MVGWIGVDKEDALFILIEEFFCCFFYSASVNKPCEITENEKLCES